MLSALRNVFSAGSFTKRAMATRSRYFVNPKPHYEINFGSPEISFKEIQINLEDMMKKITNRVKPIEENAGEGLYLGTAGIAYMFYHLSKVPALSSKRIDYLQNAFEYAKPSIAVASLLSNKKKDVPSFIIGNCGRYAVAAAIFKAIGDEDQSAHFRKLYYGAAEICKDPNFLSHGSDELFVGRAGSLLILNLC